MASGKYVAALFERLGIAEQLKDKIKLKQTAGSIAADVAKGEAEVGLQLVSEIVHVPGAELLGPLAPEIQTFIVLTSGIGSAANEPCPAGELVTFLQRPAAAEALKRGGVEPVSH